MSLKAIKDLVDAVENFPKDFRLGDKAASALSEIRALERAALDLHTSMYGRGWSSNGLHEAFALIESIAKEAK